MSRVEAGSFAPERQAVDLEELLATSAQRMARALSGRRLELEVADDLPLVDVDYTQVDQVIANLLENAARHSPQRSTVRMGARQVGEQVEVWVENSGTGVIAPDRARIFEAFHRSHGSRSSGVGLAICKAVVEAHGGTIGVRDAVGGGARFVFTLPVHRARNRSGQEAGA
jgi:two-component system sensor histidine kinase KdpD